MIIFNFDYFSGNFKSYKNMFKTAKRSRLDQSSYSFSDASKKKVENLADKLKSLHEAGKVMQKTVQQLQNGYSLSATDITDLNKKVDTLLTQCEQLLKLPDILETQQKEIEELKDKIKLLESTMELLLLGQVMMAFGQNVPKFVLQPLKIPVNRGGLPHLLNCLDPNSGVLNESLRKELEKNWQHFQSLYGMKWTSTHKTAIDEIRKDRNDKAHPQSIDFNQVEQQVSEFIQWKTECLQMIKTVKNLNWVLVIGFFSSKFEEKVVSFILQGDDKVKNISQLPKWFEKNKSTKEGTDAQERWDDLTQKKEWSWTENYNTALQEMKDLKRGNVILYEIDFKEAKMHVRDHVNSKDECCEIIDMMERLTTLSGKWELPANK